MSVPAVPPAGIESLLRSRRTPLTWVTMGVLGAGTLLVGIGAVLLGGPVGGLLSTVAAAVSFPLVLLVCFWLDRYEPEPARYRLAAIGWGGIVAVSLALLLEGLLFAVPGTDDFIDTAVTAPMVEELGKGLFLVAIVILRRSQLHGLLDGIVYGALVGVGFAFVEDIGYYAGAFGDGELPGVFLVRGVIGPFAHPLFTSATGIGVGLAVTSQRRWVRWTAPVVGFAVAVTLHGTWNGSTFYGVRGFFGAYLVVMLPMLAIVLAVAIWARHREGIILGRALTEVAQLGWIDPAEIRWVARLSDRVSARVWVKRNVGAQAVRALRAQQQTLIEVAFLHNRAMNGTAPPDLNPRMAALVQRAAMLRPYVVLPPPPRLLPPQTRQPPPQPGIAPPQL